MRRPGWPARVHPCAAVLYVCIPVYNEAATVGVLLWRLRTVLGDAGRDYEVVVYDDGSTDGTADVLAPYRRVLPLTVLGGPSTPRRGRSAATEALLRHVVAHSRYPRRDACVVLQGDFTDRPEDVPALLTAFEAGADVVVGCRLPDEAQPPAERRLRRTGPWVLRPLVRVEGVDDVLTAVRLFRVAVLRDLVRARGTAPVVDAPGWAGVVELLVGAVPFARRIDVVDVPGRYDVRPRASRLDWAAELRTLARYAWRARGTHARPGAPRPRAERPAETVTPDVRTAERPAGAPDAAAAASARETEERPARTGRRSRDGAGARTTEPASPQADANAPPAERPTTRRRRKAASERTAAGVPNPAPDAELRTAPQLTVDADVEAALPTLAVTESSVEAPAEPARRKKRRARRRSRETGADGAPESSNEAAFAGANGTGPGPHAAPDADEPEPDAPDSSDSADTPDPAEEAVESAGMPAGRRRKRRRSRSGKRPSGVAPPTSAAPPPTSDQSDAASAGASAPNATNLDRPAPSA